MNFNENYVLYFDWILLLLLFLSFCQQLFSKRFNFYGILSLVTLSLYIALHSVYSGINTLALILFLGSIFLIILEMFIPGGILGLFGTITLLIALITINDVTREISFIIVSSMLIFVVLFLVNIYVLKKKLLFLNNLVLNDKISTEKGYVAKESDVELLGEKFEAYTDLRPSGTALYNSKKYDVVTEGEFIEKGSKIVVTKVEGIRIVVRKINKEEL